MQWKPLGVTDLQVSAISLGLAALGRPGYINLGHGNDLARDFDVATMEARAHVVLDAAYAAGVRYFDTARSYGKGEVFLASWIAARGIKPSAITVGSKWGYTYTADWRIDVETHEIKEHSLENLRKQSAESRAILGPFLNLYQIHSATLESGVLDNRPVLEELARLRDHGWKIGLSLTGPRQAETLKKAVDLSIGGRLFTVVQATWNVLETSTSATLVDARAAGMGVIIKEALANGRLTARNDHRDFASKRQILESVAAKHQTTTDAIALAAVLACPWVDVVLSGASTSEQLVSNLDAQHITLDTWDQQQLAGLVESPEDYWNFRSTLPWN